MNDMTDKELLLDAARTMHLLGMKMADAEGVEKSKRLESIATKYESMARAVLWAYDRRMEAPGCTCLECLNNEELVERATGKHPSDWTRDGLMKHLGIAQEADE